MRSSLCRCSSLMPSATGTGMMPPSNAAQNASMNCSLLAEEKDQLVAAAGAETLQMIEDAERARVQLVDS